MVDDDFPNISGSDEAAEPQPAAVPRRTLIALPRREGLPDLPLDITHVVPGQRVRLVGRVDVHSVADVRTELRVAVAHGTGDLLVDMAGVEMGDTTALGVLLGAHRRAVRAGRRLVLLNLPDEVRRLLVVTRLARVLHVEVEVSVSA